MAALAAVHAADGYPSSWPADPAGWLRPRGTLASWVAAGERVVGHVAPARAPDELATLIAIPDALAVVARLFVIPSARGRGVATELLAAARAEAARRGLRAVLDVVDGAHPAITLYERLGWRRLVTGPARWTLRDGNHPLVHYYAAPR